MILAAGRGTRLGALGETTPKILVELDGEPLLARQIRYLKDGGVERIVLNTHHLSDQIAAFVAAHPQAADVDVVFEPTLLGTAGGVRNALPLLGGAPFVVLYGDVLIDEAPAAVFATHASSRALATVTVYATGDVEGKGAVELAPDGTVRAFREKALERSDKETLVNAGLYVLDPALVAELPEGAELDFGHDVFPAALRAGTRIAAHRLADAVIDIGTPSALSHARASAGDAAH
ncbi:MAG TPA: nucleotidyltransferase family protein [Solirubrobacteraceae bacterium]|jgi:mannose-1-phosphate guanylyltransferase|nr:nucleotidyltransferase family protein [Solirubrobacteraceae bacterium]